MTKCNYSGCKIKNAVYDISGGKGRFCNEHKEPGMIDVKNKRCEFDGCDVQPTYDISGGKGRFCNEHKEPGMIDVKHKRCEFDGCDVQPVYDISGGKGRFCNEHKEPGMIDVKSKRCEFDGCDIRVGYGLPGKQRSHCSQHRQLGMIRYPKRKCTDCKEPAIYGIDFLPLHCEKHKLEHDNNLLEQRCISCGLLYILDKEKKCECCNPDSFKKGRLAKQNALMDFLNAEGLPGDSTDRVIDQGNCGRERPDRIYDFHDKIVIIECDEHQHQDRACECEQTRMINIGQSFGGMPVYFIRFNPDVYEPFNPKKNSEDISKRYKLLKDLLKSIKTGKIKLPYGLVSCIYLYFDGWKSLNDQPWSILTSFEN